MNILLIVKTNRWWIKSRSCPSI